MNREKEKLSVEKGSWRLFAVSLVLLAIFLFLLATLPEKAEAIQIFSPFGGKVATWLPTAPGCAVITAAISLATLGTVNVTVEELTLANDPANVLGILRIDGITIPGLTTIFKKYLYQTPGTWVLGNSINLCDVCGKIGDIPIVNKICEIGPVKTVLSSVCSIVGSACPINNLVHYMGVGGPSLGK